MPKAGSIRAAAIRAAIQSRNSVAALQQPEMRNLPEVQDPRQKHHPKVDRASACNAPADDRRQRPAQGSQCKREGCAALEGYRRPDNPTSAGFR